MQKYLVLTTHGIEFEIEGVLATTGFGALVFQDAAGSPIKILAHDAWVEVTRINSGS